jgi:hypothetical protein
MIHGLLRRLGNSKEVKGRSTLHLLLVEMSLVVSGILLALWANQWNTEREYYDRAQIALRAIAGEIEGNLNLLNIVHPQNELSLAWMLAEETESTEQDSINIVPALQVKDVAWQTMLSTGVSEFVDYELLYSISDIYSMQDIYKSFSWNMISTIASTEALAAAIRDGDDDDLPRDLFADDVSLLVSIEVALQSSYQDALDQFESQRISPIPRSSIAEPDSVESVGRQQD